MAGADRPRGSLEAAPGGGRPCAGDALADVVPRRPRRGLRRGRVRRRAARRSPAPPPRARGERDRARRLVERARGRLRVARGRARGDGGRERHRDASSCGRRRGGRPPALPDPRAEPPPAALLRLVANLIGLELERVKAPERASEAAVGDFLADLLARRVTDRENILARGAELGCDLAAGAVRAGRPRPPAAAGGGRLARARADDRRARGARASSASSLAALVEVGWARHGTVRTRRDRADRELVIVVPGAGPEPGKRAAAAVRRELEAGPGQLPRSRHLQPPRRRPDRPPPRRRRGAAGRERRRGPRPRRRSRSRRPAPTACCCTR